MHVFVAALGGYVISYCTMSAHDVFVVGPNRQPETLTSEIKIEAIAPCGSYFFQFDSSAGAVTLCEVTGGVAQPPKSYHASGITVIEIVLPLMLQRGDHHELSFTAVLDQAVEQPPKFCRQTGCHGLRVWDVAVVFDAAHPPNRIVRTEWTGLVNPEFRPGSDIAHELEALEPEDPSSPVGVMHIFHDLAPAVTAGFAWTWPQ